MNKSKAQVLGELDVINHICKNRSIWLPRVSIANSFIYKLDSNFVVAENVLPYILCVKHYLLIYPIYVADYQRNSAH